MRNKTGLKSLDIVNGDSRVHEVYRDEDGIWLEPEYGWTADPQGAHGIHEMTAREVLMRYRDLVLCACRQCVVGTRNREGAEKGTKG